MMRAVWRRMRSSIHLRCAFLAAAVLGAGTPVAAGEPAAAPPLDQLPLEQLMRMKVVHAASRFEQLIGEAPAAASVLSATDIRAFGWRTLGEALSTLPGLFATSDRNYTYLGARGFLRPGDYNSRFILMIDGVRTNDVVYDQALLGAEGLVDMDLVQRIEFIPGAGSAIHGSSALLGVINVVTRDGSSLSRAHAGLGVGSHGERRLRASWGWHGQQGADLLLAASVLERNGEDLYFPEFGSAVRGMDGEQARQFRIKAKWGGWSFSANHVHRSKMLPTGSFGAVPGAPNRTMDAHTVAELGHAATLAPGLALALQLLWGQTDYLGHYYYPGQDGQPAPSVDGGHGRWYGFNMQATLTRFRGHKILAGVALERDARVDQFAYETQPHAMLLDERRPARRRGVFLEDEMRLGERVLLNASLRHDRHSTGARSTNPRLALLLRLAPGNTLKLIYGRAFRVPNAYEMYYAVDGEGGQRANPGLAPERAHTREAVFEHALGANGHARVSLFEYRIRGLISQQRDPGSGLLVFRNVEHARAHGLEASVEQVYADSARVRASYSWQHATDDSGAPLRAAPRHLAKLNAVMPLPFSRLGRAPRLGAELQCMTARLTEQAQVGGYCATNLTLSALRLTPRLDLALSVYNLAGRRYLDPAGPAFVQQALVREGRSASAKLSARF